MAMNMDAAIRISANVQGANAVQAFSRDLKGLDGAAKLSGAELGRMNIAINRMAREAGNTTAGLRQHLSALQSLRDRVEIGSKAYDRLGREIDQLRGKLRGLDGQVEKSGAGLRDQLIGVAATAGVGRITQGIIAGAAEFDQAVRTAAAVAAGGSGDFAGTYRDLRKEIEGVAAAAAGTPTEVANLATALSRAGFTAQETGQALRGIVTGAEATGITFEEMGSIAADTLRQFGINTSETARVVDVLVDSANSANQRVQDVGEAMKYAAPIAHSLGVTMEDTAATIALLAQSGIRGSDAGTALRTGLQRLQIAAGGADSEVANLTRGNQQLTKAMAALGSQVLNANGKLRPMDQVILGLKASMDGLSATDKAILSKALFGTEAGSKFIALMNQSSESIREMFGDLRDASGEGANTQKNMQGFAYTMKVLGGNIEIVTNAIGDAFIAVLNPLAGLLNGAISLTQSWPQPLRDVAAAAAAAGIAVGGIVVSLAAFKALSIGAAISAAVAALQGLTFATAAATVKMIALNAVTLLNPWVALAAGITAATIALAGYRTEAQKLGGRAATGDPAAITQARNQMVSKQQELSLLLQSRKDAKGRARASIDRSTTRLRAEIAQLKRDVATGERAIPAAPAMPSVSTVDGAAPTVAGGDDKDDKAAKAAAKLAAANAEKIRTSSIELRNARELYDMEGRILEARLEDNQQLILARNAQKELLSIRQQAAAITADKDLPAAAKKNALDKLAVQSGAVSRQLAFDLAELENKRALTAQEAINKLADERELLQAQLMGTEAEVMLKQRLQELTKNMDVFEKARVESLVRGNEALRQQKEAAEQMKQLYGDIGMSIKDGVVGAIQGAIDGTKSLQQVASDLLNSIANKLLDVAVNMLLFGTMSGTGTGGGLLGGLFKNAKGNAYGANGIVPFAKGGLVTAPTLFPFAKGVGLMGEAGPEAIMPLKRLPSGRLGVEAAGGGGGITVNVAVDASGSRVEGDQQQGAALGRAISAAVQAELVKQQRPGGLLAGAR